MNIGFNRVELHLAPREVIRVYDPTGARVECIQGELWITQDRDFEDYFLSANDALTLDRGGLALIHAQRRSDLVLFEPAPRPHLGARLARTAGQWFTRTFGPQSIDRPHPQTGLGAL
jgi:DUF2917 family protein